MHNRPERSPCRATRRAVVHNPAAREIVGDADTDLPAPSRSFAPQPSRLSKSTPVGAGSTGATSERTLPREGPCIRARPPRFGSVRRNSRPPMQPWTELTHFAGFDWADDHHDIVLLDRQGAIVDQWTFDHTIQGWTTC